MASFLSKIFSPISSMFSSGGDSATPGYTKAPALTDQQSTFLNQLLGNAGQQSQLAQQGYASFLPGGQGNNPIIDAANKNFQQRTLPQILQSFGSDVGFGDSSLNQALASGAGDLNTNLGAMMAQNQLSASQGLADMARTGSGLGLGTSAFDYLQTQPSFIQQMLLSLIGAAGKVGGGWASSGFSTPGSQATALQAAIKAANG